MNESAIVVFPNCAVEVDGDAVWTTEAVQEFVASVGKKQKVMLAATSVPHHPSSRHITLLKGAACFFLFSLRKARYQTTHFRQAMGYVTAIFRMLVRIPKKPLWYIFLPGHMGILACLVCCLLGKRFGVYVRGEWPKSGIVGILYRWYFRKAAFIFATGDSFADTLRQFNDQVQKVSPMMRFRVEDLREKTSYEANGRARVLYVGAINPAKGVVEVVKAMPKVANRYDIELKILGSGSPEVIESMQSEIQASGCADKIELVGQVGDARELAEWFASSDVFVLPTYNEGFPRVVYEAMGFGLPIICTDFEGGRLFLRDRENCRIVPKKDVDGLANVLVELLTDQSLRASIGKRGFLDVQELLSRFEGVSHGSQVVEAVCALHRETSVSN